jgi:hypothetical protein
LIVPSCDKIVALKSGQPKRSRRDGWPNPSQWTDQWHRLTEVYEIDLQSATTKQSPQQSKKLDVAPAMATTITIPSPMWSMNCAGCSGVTTASLVGIVSIGLASLARMSGHDHEPPEQNSQQK